MSQKTYKISTRVLPGSKIEVTAPGLEEGDHVEVLIRADQPAAVRTSILEYLDSLPPGPRLFQTPEEADAYLQAERDSWDR